MAIRFALPADGAESLSFAYSPLLETVLSLHVLVAPKHHALQHPWVRQMRRLPPRLRREISALSFLYRWTFPNLVLPSATTPYDDFSTELAQLRRVPSDAAVFELLRPVYDHGGRVRLRRRILADAGVRRVALANARMHGAAAERAATQLFDDRDAFAARFAQLLEDYWYEAFADEWHRNEPKLAQAVAAAGRQIASLGVYPFLVRLAPQLRVEPSAGTFGLDVPHDHRVELSAANPLLLVPSVFVWPHVRVNCDEPWPPVLIYRAPHLARTLRHSPATQLAQLLRVLADPTRLRMVKLIARRPRSTQELAPLVRLTEGATSKHLRQLAAAGVVEARREGYYVVYSIVPARLRRIPEELADWLAPTIRND
jgi:DNA-binding transcriptional ArsR family regulator